MDQLSWEKFFETSSKLTSIPNKVEDFNRLIAHTKNFFVISGYGAFTPGYLIIITKKFIPSFAIIDKDQITELKTLIDFLKKFIEDNYNRKSILFEHGMCACVGGLDRAHLHLMSIPLETTKKTLNQSINDTLENRKAGINHIYYNNYKLENKHDIETILNIVKNNKSEKKKLKISGKILKKKDIQNLNYKNWPLVASKHVRKGGHYVYFNSEIQDASFLTTKNFQTQMGREIVYRNEILVNKEFFNKMKDTKFFEEPWKWQNQLFEKNILNTIKLARKKLKLIFENEKLFNNLKIEIL